MPRIFSGRVILYLLLLLIADLTITPFFQIGSARPVLQYLMVLYAAFQWDWKKAVPMAFAVGILRDLTNSPWLGAETMSLVLAALLLDFWAQKMVREIFGLRLLIGFVFLVCALFLNFIVSGLVSETVAFSWYDTMTILGTALYTVLLAPFFFWLTAKWFHDRFLLKQYELFG